jgi:hypothetical protein
MVSSGLQLPTRWFIYKLADLEKNLDAVVANTGDGTARKPPKAVEAFHTYCPRSAEIETDLQLDHCIHQ